eukprot:scaffold34643_cov62-Phaeocystis_antarctica.AAC.6
MANCVPAQSLVACPLQSARAPREWPRKHQGHTPSTDCTALQTTAEVPGRPRAANPDRRCRDLRRMRIAAAPSAGLRSSTCSRWG